MPSAASRSRGPTGEGRLLVPLMLLQGLPVRDAGPPRRGDRDLRGGGRGRAARPATPTTSSGRCSSSAGRTTTPATSTARSRPARRALGSAGGWPAGRCPRPAAGPAGRSASPCFEAGETERGLEAMPSPGRRRARVHDPGRALLRLGDARARRARARATRRRPSLRTLNAPSTLADGLDLHLPAGACRCAPGPPSCSPAGEPEAAVEPARAGVRADAAAGARLQAAFSRSLSGPRARRGRASATRRSPSCARPSASSTPAAPCACATRCGASCASSARAPSRAGRPRRRLRGRRADQARARDRRARHRPHDEPRDRRASCS